MLQLEIEVPAGAQSGQQVQFTPPGRHEPMSVSVPQHVQPGSVMTVQYSAPTQSVAGTVVSSASPVTHQPGVIMNLPNVPVIATQEDKEMTNLLWSLYALGLCCGVFVSPILCFPVWAVSCSLYFCKPEASRLSKPHARTPALVAAVSAAAGGLCLVTIFLTTFVLFASHRGDHYHPPPGGHHWHPGGHNGRPWHNRHHGGQGWGPTAKALPSPPSCAWSPTDRSCAGFEIGDRLVVGQLGALGCPLGSVSVTDSSRCQEAAVRSGFPFDTAGTSTPRGVFGSGGRCLWDGRSQKVKMQTQPPLQKDKFICEEDPCTVRFDEDLSGNFDHISGDGVRAESEAECSLRCSHVPECTAWVREPANNGSCYLSRTVGPAFRDGSSSSFARNGGFRCEAALGSCVDMPQPLAQFRGEVSEATASYTCVQWATSLGVMGTCNAAAIRASPHCDERCQEAFADGSGFMTARCPRTCGLCGSLTCTDIPNWADRDGDDCQKYESSNWCAIYGSGYRHDGHTASEACCACGGGQGVQQQSTCTDLAGWADIDGDNCERYDQSNWCDQFGNGYANHNHTANQACCACGGGQGVHHESDFGPDTGGGGQDDICSDVGGWSDSDGDTCERYVANQWCEHFGSGYRHAGHTANTACCGCGGGVGAGGEAVSDDSVDDDGGDSNCADTSGWSDSDGDTCARYDANNWCERLGHMYESGGLTASAACCACGGGSTAPTPSPLVA